MLDFTRLMLISTQVEVVVEVGVELGKSESQNGQKVFKLARHVRGHEKLLGIVRYC